LTPAIALLACLLLSTPTLAASIATPAAPTVAKPVTAKAPNKPAVRKVASQQLAPASRPTVSEPAGVQAADPAAAAPSAQSQPPGLAELTQGLRNYFTEEETGVLYEFMKDSLVSSLKGDEPEALPPDLAFKMEVLIARMKREGGAYMDRLSKEIEADLKKRTAPPPPVEYIPSRPWPENNPWLSR
jgi:hypothetical protein